MDRLRVDRTVTVGLIHPFLKAYRRVKSAGNQTTAHATPVLMYHSISNRLDSDLPPYYRTVTSLTRFTEQMHYLDTNGWRGVSLRQWKMISTDRISSHSRKPVVLTFDDGFRDFYLAAAPVLKRFGYTATMYLPTDFVSSARRCFSRRECLTWKEVRELRASGMHFGSHTATHPILYNLSWANIEREVKTSKARIEEELQEEIDSFAYPFAFPQEDTEFGVRLKDVLQNCGYRECATTMLGRMPAAGGSFYIRRLPMNSSDDVRLFSAKLEGGYDWLSTFQKLYRRRMMTWDATSVSDHKSAGIAQ